MHIILRILKGIAQFLVSWGLWIVLASGLNLVAISTHLTNRDTVKGWPVEAGVYENIIDIFPSLIAEEGGSDDGRSIDEQLEDSGLDKDQLIAAIESVITPSYIEQQANVAIDALYDALEGEKDVLAFKIDLNEKSLELQQVLIDELTSQIRSYPACTPLELTELSSGQFDPLSAKCIPPGVNVNREINFSAQDLTQGEESILGEIEVTAGDASPINRNISVLQDAFASSKNAAQYMVGMVLLLGVLTVILARSVLYGLRKFGSILFIQGVSTAAIFFFLPKLSSRASDVLVGQGEDDVQQLVIDKAIEPLFTVALEDIAATGFRIGMLVGLAGAIFWLSVYSWHKIHHHPQDAHAPKAPVKKDKKKAKHSLNEY